MAATAPIRTEKNRRAERDNTPAVSPLVKDMLSLISTVCLQYSLPFW